MFRGRYEHTIDKKGRTSVPARFRDVLSARSDLQMVITAGLDPCLVAYPLSEWTAFEERLAALPQFDPKVTMLRRIVVSSAMECEVDKLGRVLIPSSLRQYAGLERETVWAGMGTHVEIWAQARFEEIQSRVLSDSDERTAIAERLSELGL